jgi:hypothetical protein
LANFVEDVSVLTNKSVLINEKMLKATPESIPDEVLPYFRA